MKKEALKAAVQKVLESGKPRKFTQTIELILNFQRLDFKKPEERVNLDIMLPKGRGREPKIAMFAEGQTALDAKKAGIELIMGKADIEALVGNKKGIRKLLAYDFLAQPQLMSLVGKVLGPVLGVHGKMPRPVMPNMTIAKVMEQARTSVPLKARGKYLPVVQCPVGTEAMSPDDLAENITTVIDAVTDKYGNDTIKKAFLKKTMGPPVALEVG